MGQQHPGFSGRKLSNYFIVQSIKNASQWSFTLCKTTFSSSPLLPIFEIIVARLFPFEGG